MKGVRLVRRRFRQPHVIQQRPITLFCRAMYPFIGAAIALLCLLTKPDVSLAENPELETLHGTVITALSNEWPPAFGESGVASEIWAKGNSVRSETKIDSTNVVSLQCDGVLYTFIEGSRNGTRQRLPDAALGALGLIKQIQLIKALGTKRTESGLDGAAYDIYLYASSLEAAEVHLSPQTSMPQKWISVLWSASGAPKSALMIFRGMEGNIPIDDELFEIPGDIDFREEPLEGLR